MSGLNTLNALSGSYHGDDPDFHGNMVMLSVGVAIPTTKITHTVHDNVISDGTHIVINSFSNDNK